MAITSLYVKMFSQGPEERVNSIFRVSRLPVIASGLENNPLSFILFFHCLLKDNKPAEVCCWMTLLCLCPGSPWRVQIL